MFFLNKNFTLRGLDEILSVLLIFFSGLAYYLDTSYFFTSCIFATGVVTYLFTNIKSSLSDVKKQNKLLNSLPFTRKDIINDIYLSYLIYPFILSATMIVSHMFFSLVTGKSYAFYPFIYALMFFICICIISVNLPLDLYDNTTTNLIKKVVYLAIIMFPVMLSKLDIYDEVNGYLIKAMKNLGITAFLILTSSAIYLISYFVTLNIYLMRDF